MSPNSNKVNNSEVSASTEYFQIFKVMYDNGDVARMGSNAFNIYAYIKATIRHDDPETYPTVEQIAESTGISRATVLREIPKLVEMNYITQRKQGRKAVYTVNERIPIVDMEGSVRGTATWEYIPAMTAKAVDEVQAIMKGRIAPDGAHFVHIENVQIIVSHVEQGATQNNVQATTIGTQVIGKESLLEGYPSLDSIASSNNPKAHAQLARMVRPSVIQSLELAESEQCRKELELQLALIDEIIAKDDELVSQ